MKHKTVISDFKDLRKAIEEVTAKQPAKSRYQQQAEKMGYVVEASAMNDMKDIVKNKSAKKIGGVMVDMFTASVITKAYDKVNDANKKKMDNANVHTLVKLAHKVMGMKEELELDEGKMSDLLVDIQQGATAKELSKDFKIPLAVAKSFLNDYYGSKKRPRREEVQSGMHVEIINEKFKPDNIKSRQTGKKLVAFDAYIQFRGGKGDRITSPENKKDWEKAIKLTQMWLRKHKIKRDINNIFSHPDEGSSAYKMSIELNDQEFKKSPDALDDLVNQISKLKTAEDHGGGHREHPMNEETINERIKLAQIVRKHKAALMKAKRSGSLELPSKVEDDLQQWVFDNEPHITDDPDDFDQWLDDNIDDLVPTLKIKEETISEESISYQLKARNKNGPEYKKFEKSAKMMKLKMTSKINAGNKMVAVVSGTKKNLRDFDAVVRGHMSYGDPSTIKHFDETLKMTDTVRKMWQSSIDENNMERSIMKKMRKGRVAKGMPR